MDLAERLRSLTPLHKFHDVAIRVLNHRDADTGPEFLLRHYKLYPFALEFRAEFRKIFYDKRDVAEP